MKLSYGRMTVSAEVRWFKSLTPSLNVLNPALPKTISNHENKYCKFGPAPVMRQYEALIASFIHLWSNLGKQFVVTTLARCLFLVVTNRTSYRSSYCFARCFVVKRTRDTVRETETKIHTSSTRKSVPGVGRAASSSTRPRSGWQPSARSPRDCPSCGGH